MTVREIAAMFGVAPSTVSVVLNDRPGVRKEMREKIAEALINNGYTIKNKKNEPQGSLLFLYYKSTDYVASRNDNTISSYLLGIEEVCAQRNFTFSVSNATDETIDQLLSAAGEEYAGVILLGTEYYEAPSAAFYQSSAPLVVLDAFFPETSLNTVNMDNSYGVHQAISHLASCGHQSIGYLKSRQAFGCLRDRSNRIEISMRTLGLGELAVVLPVSQEAPRIQEEVAAYLESAGDIPTAFIADNDYIAISAMQTFQERGLRVPEDVSFVGFDDAEICTLIRPHLTTVRADLKEMARQAALRLISLIEDPAQGFTRLEVGTSLIVRESVAVR